MGNAWKLRDSDLKGYPHFDPIISAEEGEALATDPKRVAEHPFYPFMLFQRRWKRFAPAGQERKPKARPIRYAARGDAYIFSRYRHLLSELYEAELRLLGLEGSVLAYRRIPDESGGGGKCNIHYARDAFLKIREFGDCFAVALDISSYFESLDHERLETLWCRLLGTNRLPADHLRVFQAITKYAVVEKEKAYERLGHYGEKRKSKNGKPIRGYLTKYNEIPKQLCIGRQFREKIAGEGADKSIIEKNFKPYGIPQGAPISDLLANLYLIDFDKHMADWTKAVGGAYYRYSDDILIIGPGADAEALEVMEQARRLIRGFGRKLRIKREKSAVFVFERQGADQMFRLIHGEQGRNGLEYLGFRYDGRQAYLRDSTLSNLHRKVALAARREANACAIRYPDKGLAQLLPIFNYERLITKFGRVEDFGEKRQEYRNWTFWTYARRASDVYGPLGKRILKQLGNHRSKIRARARLELERAVARRDKRSVP